MWLVWADRPRQCKIHTDFKNFHKKKTPKYLLDSFYIDYMLRAPNSLGGTLDILG